MAEAFPCNAIIHKWGILPSAACALCGHPAETQSRIQCLCPALSEARIRAHNNIARRLCKGIADSTIKWTVEQTVAGLQGLPQPPRPAATDRGLATGLRRNDRYSFICKVREIALTRTQQHSRRAKTPGRKVGQTPSLHPGVHQAE